MSAQAISTVALETLRSVLRQPYYWLLTLLGVFLSHYAHIFNLTAFRAPQAFTQEMTWSTYWLVTVLLAATLGWRTAGPRSTRHILLLSGLKIPYFVFGLFLGCSAALGLALIGHLAISTLFSWVWQPESVSIALVSRNLACLGVSFLGGIMTFGWCHGIATALPRSAAGMGILIFLVVAHSHPLVFGTSDSFSLISSLVPNLGHFGYRWPFSSSTSAPILEYLGLTCGYALVHICLTATGSSVVRMIRER